MAKFLKTPFKESWPAASGSSDYSGVSTLAGDIEVSGSKTVLGVKIGEAPQAVFDYLNELNGKS